MELKLAMVCAINKISSVGGCMNEEDVRAML